MHSVSQIAKYILHEAGEMTTMKLQKLVFYCQAWSLAWDGEPLFPEDFEAWAGGPVCPELFRKHKGNFLIDEDVFDGIADADFTRDEIETIEAVLDTYNDKSPQWLSDKTHSERPWKEARGSTAPGYPCSVVISKELIQDYYSGLY